MAIITASFPETRTRKEYEWLNEFVQLTPKSDMAVAITVEAKDADAAVSKCQGIMTTFRKRTNQPLLRAIIRASATDVEGTFDVTVHRAADAAEPVAFKPRKKRTTEQVEQVEQAAE